MKTRRTGFDKEGLMQVEKDAERQALRRSGDSEREADEGDAEAEAAEFRELLGGHLSRWDERIQPPVPHLSSLEQLVSRHKEELGRKLWRDLLLLWTLGVFIVGGLLLMLQWNIVAFVCLQAAAFAGAIVYLFVHSRRDRSVKRKWTA